MKEQPKPTKKPKKEVTECSVTGEPCEYKLESCVGASCPIFCDYAIGDEW